jgi:2-deoxy-D-gluconate 3-dehydrogenase
MSSSLFSLAGQTAVLTGATRGIGRAIAVGLAEAGADIVLLQVCLIESHAHSLKRDVTQLESKQTIEHLGRKCAIVECYLASQESVSNAIGKVVEAGLDFDILINCGGITHCVPPEEFPDEKWNQVLHDSITMLTIDNTSQFDSSIPTIQSIRKTSPFP